MPKWNKAKLRAMQRRRTELYSTVRYLSDRRDAARDVLGRARRAEQHRRGASPTGPSAETIAQRSRCEKEIADINEQLSDASSRWEQFASICDRCVEYAHQHLGWRE